MATSETTRSRSDGLRTSNGTGGTARRLSTETKSFSKTSEFVAYVVTFVGILIAANVIESDGGRDFFTADKAWLYITILTVGYMVSRGIAKAGVRDPYWGERADSNATR